MVVPTMSDLYNFYETLNSEASTEAEKELAYKSILNGIKGGGKEKRLACQFIVRFSKQFDALQEQSFNCILDLCDDEDVLIRKQAVHDLLQFSKRLRSFIPRVADVLVQMLLTDDATEVHLVTMSLTQLLHMEPKPVLVGLFNQLLTINSENPRDHIMRFLAERLKTIPETVLTTEVEEFVVEQINKVLQDVSEEEFQLLISILSSLKCMSTVPGRQKLVCMITEQALQAVPEFNATDPACIAQIRESCKQTALCVSKNVHAKELYLYLLAKVIPCIHIIPIEYEEDQLSLLRATAELSTHNCTELIACSKDELKQFLGSIYLALDKMLPVLPSSTVSTDPSVTETSGSVDGSVIEETPLLTAGLKFSELECLLYISCQLGRCLPQYFGGYMTEEEKEQADTQEGLTRLRAIRPRLQYLSRASQEYSQSIATLLSPSNGAGLDENKLRVIAHRLVTNIQLLVRSFFHNPPVFKIMVPLSWLPAPANPNATVVSGTKRTLSADRESDVDSAVLPATPSGAKREQARYAPPIGRWSHSSGKPPDAPTGNRGRWFGRNFARRRNW